MSCPALEDDEINVVPQPIGSLVFLPLLWVIAMRVHEVASDDAHAPEARCERQAKLFYKVG